jgi:hypothetical protein
LSEAIIKGNRSPPVRISGAKYNSARAAAILFHARCCCRFFFDSRMEIYGTSRGNAAGVVTSVAFFINEIEQACRGPCITQRTVMILQANAVDFAESTKAV